MLSLAVCVLLALSCSAASNWWETEILYQIYPVSFADSNGDGYGDLRGIIEHVDYLAGLGIGVVWLSPIYKSPWEDMGYDISNYMEVQPIFGTNQDLKDLIATVHDNGMKILLDLVPNHTSDQHRWFLESKKSANGPHADFYVWKDPIGWNGSEPIPPNNWVSVFGGSAWEYVPERKQFYLHQFGSYQPDLNYVNPKVVEAMKDVMRFWLDMRVDGFRVDAVPYLVEDPELRNEPMIPGCNNASSAKCFNHIYTQNQPGTYEVLAEFDKMINEEYDHRFLYLEAYAPINKTVEYYNNISEPFNFELIQKFKIDTNATGLKNIIDNYLSHVPSGKPLNWVVGNHDNSRVGSRLGEELVDAVSMLVLLLPGAGVTYQGEEIGMTDTYLRSDQEKDDRDPERTPFQWSNSRNAGFTSNATRSWLPVNPNFWRLNVADENLSNSSHLSIYRQLVQARKVLSGPVITTTLSDWVFAIQREGNQKKYYVLINLNNFEEEVALSKGFSSPPPAARVFIASENSAVVPFKEVSTENIFLRPRSGLVLES